MAGATGAGAGSTAGVVTGFVGSADMLSFVILYLLVGVPETRSGLRSRARCMSRPNRCVVNAAETVNVMQDVQGRTVHVGTVGDNFKLYSGIPRAIQGKCDSPL